MDHIDEQLAQIALDKKKYLAAVRAAASLGRKTCNRYYERSDETAVYRLVMSAFLPLLLPSCSDQLVVVVS